VRQFGGGFALQAQRAAGAGRHAQPAADAALPVDRRPALGERDGVHLAALEALAAAAAQRRRADGVESGRDQPPGLRVALDVAQHPAAIAAAAAEILGVLRVARLEHQPGAVGALQDVQRLFERDGAPAPLADRPVGGAVQREAGFERLAAALARQLALLAANARGDRKARAADYNRLDGKNPRLGVVNKWAKTGMWFSAGYAAEPGTTNDPSLNRGVVVRWL